MAKPPLKPLTAAERAKLRYAGEEAIAPPARKAKSDASTDLKEGGSAGGRVLADASVAKRQGVTRKNEHPKKTLPKKP